MRGALDVYDPTPAARGPWEAAAEYRWETTEDISHTGISADVALGRDGSLVDRTGGAA
ncbi:hypothetical protein GCM10010505_72170 [Kitasatospora aburaviensis]